MKLRRFGANLRIRHAAHDLVDFRKRAVDGLEDLERLLLHDVERAPDALVGIIVIQSIASGLTLLNLSSSLRFMITGAVLAIAVIVDSLARQSRVSHGRA